MKQLKQKHQEDNEVDYEVLLFDIPEETQLKFHAIDAEIVRTKEKMEQDSELEVDEWNRIVIYNRFSDRSTKFLTYYLRPSINSVRWKISMFNLRVSRMLFDSFGQESWTCSN